MRMQCVELRQQNSWLLFIDKSHSFFSRWWASLSPTIIFNGGWMVWNSKFQITPKLVRHETIRLYFLNFGYFWWHKRCRHISQLREHKIKGKKQFQIDHQQVNWVQIHAKCSKHGECSVIISCICILRCVSLRKRWLIFCYTYFSRNDVFVCSTSVGVYLICKHVNSRMGSDLLLFALRFGLEHCCVDIPFDMSNLWLEAI